MKDGLGGRRRSKTAEDDELDDLSEPATNYSVLSEGSEPTPSNTPLKGNKDRSVPSSDPSPDPATKTRSNSDTRLSQYTVLLPTQNSNIFVQLNSMPTQNDDKAQKQLMQKVTKKQAGRESSRGDVPLLDGSSRPRSNSNAQEYGSTANTPTRTPLTPRRKRLIVLEGRLAFKVQQQLRQAWPGAWFALRLDRAFLRTYHSIRKYRQPGVNTRPTRAPAPVTPVTPDRTRVRPRAGSGGKTPKKFTFDKFDKFNKFDQSPGRDDYDEALALLEVEDEFQGATLSSTATVFVLVTNMFSGGLLVIPYAFCQSGLIGGIAITAFMAVVCCYTAACLIRLGEELNTSDFGFIFGFRLGKWAKVRKRKEKEKENGKFE